MKRPAGLIACAFVLALASLFQIVMALGMALAGAVAHDQSLPATRTAPLPPPWMPEMIYGTAAFFLLLAAWGIATTIGVYKLRRWARGSILIIGGSMAVIGFVSALACVAMIFVPLPASPAVESSRGPSVQTAVHIVFLVCALFYAAICAMGVWWLIYFNVKSIRTLFAAGEASLAEPRRPLLISVYAVLLLSGALCFPFIFIVKTPAVFFTVLLHGWARTALYGALCALNVVTGVGLWRLKEWARRLALVLLAYGFVQMLIYILRPALAEQVALETQRAMQLQPAPPPIPFTLNTVIFSFSLLFMAAIVWMLHAYRARFRESLEAIETAPPPMA